MAGNTLHRWETKDGQRWACGAYDHSPFCRLCQPVDDTLDACLNNVELGRFLWSVDSHGEFSFQVTALGQAEVAEMMQTLTSEDD